MEAILPGSISFLVSKKGLVQCLVPGAPLNETADIVWLMFAFDP